VLNLFERNEEFILQVVNLEAYNCGYFSMLVKIILHSVVQEGPGFPYFPLPIYYYICTQSVDLAIEYLSPEALPFEAKVLFNEVGDFEVFHSTIPPFFANVALIAFGAFSFIISISTSDDDFVLIKKSVICKLSREKKAPSVEHPRES